MATPDQVQKIQSVVDTLTKTPIDALVSNQEQWGTINFETARRDLVATIGLGRHIKELPMDKVPDVLADDLLRLFNLANAAVQRMTTFTIESDNATGQRDEIVAQVQQSAAQLLETVKSMYKDGVLGR